jgi:hypothetical protein
MASQVLAGVLPFEGVELQTPTSSIFHEIHDEKVSRPDIQVFSQTVWT